ncbi:Epsin-3, clathrin recruitment and traffic between the Golgi and endosome [Borealophlyctis nickersoniae]|nr:Epsin-3, clathrin recruitment and traffic between the Golgi and endosome [Borealophlyctis nickersoniae]
MDLNSLSNFIDVRAVSSMVNKVKNAVYNYTEFEIKVRDATNNEPWGASSTLMQEIAAGGPQWRQVYKALQLLEYLIKNGAERVIDSARDHIYELKALKNFHYVDDKQKDQGINVRNRANEIQELLANNDKIKEERRKAKENRNKYTGVSSDGTGSFGGSKYGGFGSESFRSGGFREDSRPATPVRRESESSSRGYDSHGVSSTSTGTTDKGKISIKMTGSSAAAPSAQPQPAANLLDIDSKGDDWGDFTSAPSAPAGSSAAAGRTSGFGDFADFQSAPASAAPPTNFASFPTPGSAHPSASGSGQNSGFANFANFSAPVASQTTIAQPSATGMDLLGDLGGSGGGSTGGGFGAFAGFGGAAMSAPLSANGTASTPIKVFHSYNLWDLLLWV